MSQSEYLPSREKKVTRFVLRTKDNCLALVTLKTPLRVGELNEVEVEKVISGSLGNVSSGRYRIGEKTETLGFHSVYPEI